MESYMTAKKKRSSQSSYRTKLAAGGTEIKQFDNKDIHPMIYLAAKLKKDHPERWIRTKKKKCPECEGTLMERDGRYGNFYGCSNYPRCKYTEKLTN